MPDDLPVFYAICQASFYIICFWSKELLPQSDGLDFLEDLNFKRVIESALQPLKVTPGALSCIHGHS